jgi:hypothetical protein
MVNLEVVLSPDEADLVMRALDPAREVTHQQTSNRAFSPTEVTLSFTQTIDLFGRLRMRCPRLGD